MCLVLNPGIGRKGLIKKERDPHGRQVLCYCQIFKVNLIIRFILISFDLSSMSVAESKFLEVREAILASPFAKRNAFAKRKHLISYMRYRLLRPLLKLKYSKYQKHHPKEPWLTPDAIRALKQLLEPHFSGLEYGSGRSTVFFAKQLSGLTSLEHNPDWYQYVQHLLSEEGIDNVQLTLIEPTISHTLPKLSSEEQVKLSDIEYPVGDHHYQDYIDFLDQVADESLDFILVDGRARKSCALKAIPKLKPGGLLVLDNSERKRYIKVHHTLSSWNSIFTTTGLTDTTIWRKP